MEVYTSKKECCGCTACMNICPKNAIKMIEDEEGFKYPKIDEKKCIECGLCKKICAFQNGYKTQDKLKEINVYASKNKSDDIRIRSSSGGMFVPLSDYVLNNNGVVYGVAFNEKFKAIHIKAENKENRDRCIGSKYSQSDLKDTYKKVKKDLENNKLVLFTGTPCQVGGLNKYLGNINKEKLILVDIVCHGTPSPKLFNEYIKYIERKRKKKIKIFNHRTKEFGWKHNEKIIYDDGKIEVKSNLSQAWKYVFYTHFALRPSCYNCKYTNINRPSDITIADFWGIDKFAPEFVDSKGVSLVIVNTKKGENIFDNIKEKITSIERKIEEAVEKNPNLVKPTKEPIERETFWEQYKNKGIEFILKQYGRYNFKCITKDIIKRILKK